MIPGIIFVAVFNEFGNDNFQLVVIQPRKYTYLQGITRNIVLCAFIEFWLLESRNADSETAGGPALLSINIFEQRLLRGSRLWPSAFGPSIYFLALFHRILGGRPPDNESQSPFSTFQCSFSGFRRPFSRFQSPFFGFQSQSLKSLAPRCPPGSTLQHFWHQFGRSFR